jgi:diguanylate cyclase (GGDEF)-like protein/PAS domain S-box-containing protein
MSSEKETRNSLLEILAIFSSQYHKHSEAITAKDFQQDLFFGLQTILDQIGAYIFMKDLSGRYIYVNKSVQELFGASLENIIGHDDSHFFDLAISNELTFNDRCVIEKGQTIEREETTIIKSSGETRIYWTVKQPVLNDHGEIIGMCGISTDITRLKQEEYALAESRNLLKAIIDTAPVRIFWKDTRSQYLGCNPSFAKDAGIASPEHIVGLNDYDLAWTQDQADHYRRDDQQVIESGCAKLDYEEPLNKPDGKTIFLQTSKVPLRNMSGEIIGVLGIYQDITERKRANESMKLATTIYQSSREAILVTDKDNLIIEANAAFTRLTGYELAEILGKNPRIFQSGRHKKAFFQRMWQKLLDNDHWQGEVWDRRKDGTIHAKWVNITVIRNPDQSIYCFVAQFSDITEKKQKDELIQFQANYDPLTSLPNRNLFKDRLRNEIKKSQRSGLLLSLIFIDLDHFKDINDSLGHAAGDQLLKIVAQRIMSCVRETDTVARLGGDEFAVILPDIGDKPRTEKISQHIIQELSQPLILDKNRINQYISASIGIAFYPEDGLNMEILMRNADMAMYKAKSEGRNRVSQFTPSMQRAAQERILLTNDLRNALRNNELQIYYQPIVNLSDHSIIKAEALLRWQHPQHGMINPAAFIPLAEESGLILPVGEWVFDQCSNQIKRWHKQFGHIIQISVNKSPMQFNQRNKYSWPDKLAGLNLPGNSINVEITEGLLLKNSPNVRAILKEFRTAGIEISIDDFGTGFSSLSYLKEFDIDYLKIDRSFTSNLNKNKTDHALIEAIILMAHKLDIKTIAEGVETQLQQDLLMELGCDFVQGYFYSSPVPIEEFEKLIVPQWDKHHLN